MIDNKDLIASYKDVLIGSKQKDFSELPEGSVARIIKEDKRIVELAKNLVIHGSKSFTYIVNYSISKYVYLSSGVKDLFGYEPEYFLEGGFEVVSKLIYPEDFSVLQEYWNRSVVILADWKSKKLDWRLLGYVYIRYFNSQGEIIYTRQSNALIHFEGIDGPMIDFGSFHEISESKNRKIGYEIWASTEDGLKLIETRDVIAEVIEAPITARELQVLTEAAAGKRADVIAKELGLSRHTIYFNFKMINEKLGTATTAEAVAMARRNGWIEA